jgi:DNA recombination protein RmuC
MNSVLLCGILFVVGGLLGLGVGGAVTWFLWGQPKAKALMKLRAEFEKQEMQKEVEAEKVAWVEQAEAKMREAFEALASQSLKSNADELLNRSKSELSHLVDPLEKGLDKLDTHIRDLEQKREGAYQGLRQHLEQLGQAQQALQETTVTLRQALKSSGTRGRWGELQLRRVVELAGMVEHVDFEEQVTTDSGRPDLVVNLPNGGVVPVDAKVPMNAYLEASAAEERKIRQEKLDAHTKAVRSRVKQLARKRYWSQFDRAPEFVVMFVPSESCLSAAFERDGALLDEALQERIIIASPVTLLAVLKAVAYGWQQVSVAENARKIADEGKQLYQRIGKLAEYIVDMGAGLDRSVDAYNSLIGSLEYRLLPTARKFEDLAVDAAEMPVPHRIDRATRSLTADELRE